MAEITIYTAEKGPRALFAINHVFARMLGYSLSYANSLEELSQIKGVAINYSETLVEGAFNIVPSGALAKGAVLNNPSLTSFNGNPVAFPTKGDLPFDIFSFVFLLLSRAEEYTGAKDEHGRFDSSNAWVVKQEIALQPIVDVCVLQLQALLQERWPSLPHSRRTYNTCVTFDIDNGLKYAGREWWRSLGSMMRDVLQFRFAEVVTRLGVLVAGKSDPYELNKEMKAAAEQSDRCLTFFLVGERSANDHAVPLNNARMAKKIKAISGFSEVGLHPSYRAMEEPARTEKELNYLGVVLGTPPHYSRQHFLKFRLPQTYRTLIDLGIGEDHSMGFANRVGFRAGTCTPFPWYDLEEESETNLMIHPFAFMDSALCYKLKLEKKDALKVCQKLISNVYSVQGTLESIWHERFIAGQGAENEWNMVFGEAIEEAKRK